LTNPGTIYLIPNLLGETYLASSIPQGVVEVVQKLKHLIVEDEKNARRFLKLCNVLPPFEGIVFHVLDKHTTNVEKSLILETIKGTECGILSEAGCPGIADPGAEIVGQAHRKGFIIKPLVGPSSILLGLIASGFNGQAFSFHGYLPVNPGDRVKRLKELEADTIKTGYTQIFIETPFRNESLYKDILASCKPTTLLSVAMDITLPSEFIRSASIKDWQSKPMPELRGHPAVFSLWVGQQY